ncbi:MAG: polyphenol oxidase family protein [Planctomycetota bacterium]
MELGGGAVALRSPKLEALGVPHLFTTRLGPAGELCVRGCRRGELETVRSGLGAGRAVSVVQARQIHGAAVVEVEFPGPSTVGDADALVTSRPEAALMVYTADCVPVLVASSDGRRVGAIHAGWRGLVQGVIPAAIERFGEAPAAAAIGACLSRERCEMGPEAAEQFVDAGLAEVVGPGPGDRARVDVRAAARLQLERAGVGQIDVSGDCTWNDARLFHSHRRDVTHGSRDRAGSLGALIAIRA